jgi:hypothetical protein
VKSSLYQIPPSGLVFAAEWEYMDGLREPVSWVVWECPIFEPGAEWRGWGRKQKEKTRERSGCRGGRQAQMIDMFPSREDQIAAWEFVSGEG